MLHEFPDAHRDEGGARLSCRPSPGGEFGLRRAQGAGGALWASRAAVVGGCASTSNVLAGKMFDIPVSGTHAHSWVMAFDSEIEAFRAYAKTFPKNCILLVDTYDVKQGIEHAIEVGLEMRAQGERLAGIRIDSGDLAWLARYARERLDAAGLVDCGIVLSNGLDEYTIKSIRDQGADVMSWGVGTRLACAYDQPSLGGVYKLFGNARCRSCKAWSNRLKVSEQSSKLTLPGVLDVRRYSFADGRIAGDMVFDVNEPVDGEGTSSISGGHPSSEKTAGYAFETLLHPLARRGVSVLSDEERSALAARERHGRRQFSRLDESQKRFLNPHSYPVGLEAGLWHRRASMAAALRESGRADGLR